MRLTLRTLLAYMDDILEPADHDELAKKIESSDFATELIHRCRDTVRRLRLGAPAVAALDGEDVLGNETTADANTVAQYLDNTLPPESVAEFERICLEPGIDADMHLAEVTSCHHILTMVLGEPAEIDMRIRERMYAIPAELAAGTATRREPAHTGFTPVPPIAPPVMRPAAVAATTVAPARRDERSSEVPDYLRAATRARQAKIRWFTAAAVLAMIGGVGYFVLTPPETTELADSIKSEIPVGDLQIGDAVPTDSAPPAPSGGVADTQAPPFVPGSAPDPNVGSAAPAIEPFEETPAPSSEANPPAEQPVVEPPADPGLAAASAEGPAEPPVVSLPTQPPVTPPQDDPVEDSVDLTASDSEAESSDAAELESVEPESPPEPPGPAQLGQYVGGSGDVLLRRDEMSGKWIRLPPRTTLTAGDRLLAPPKFRTHVALDDANLYLSGGTQLQLVEPLDGVADAPLRLNIAYGRVLLNAGLNGSHQVIVVGDQERDAELGGSASLAVEVRRVFVPGSNMEEETAPIEAHWYLTSGSLQWPGQAGDMQTVNAPATWKTVDGVDEIWHEIDALPEWIDREDITDMERRARTRLAEELAPGEPVGMTLLELNDPSGRGRQKEVRTLAAEASVYVGQFEPFVKSLSDTQQSQYWQTHIDSMRAALALSPALATQVREAFVKLRGPQAAEDLMEMVRGFSPEEVGQTREELQQGALVTLLEWLESDSLDYRVLAIYNLNQITGTSYLAGYRPEMDSTRRERALRKLWDRFEANELLPATP